MTFEFLCDVYEFPTADESLQHADASGRGSVITLAGRYFVAAEPDIDRLAAAGIEFAFVCDHELPDGTFRMVTVPVN